ncbi:menaquinone biosynthesis protein [Alkalicoccus chagannorensis]|uniref:menaquinone biosynthesis protein n=1 Tax=Alkalicoccus chagannorensis TaxID=427072 RepID=UPI0004121335|nr:menaquinone biosynthesis protein [Alkalicoccus chagannorensis]
MALHVGEIKYTNIQPMFSKLPKQALEDEGFSFSTAVPSQLNERMAQGTVDVGGISSFEYARHAEEYMLLPELSVASDGAVGSIYLFSRFAAEELEGRNVALTASSATSVHLLKLILQRSYGVQPYYRVMEPDLEQMLSECDACLLIGDDAIQASFQTEEKMYQYDLGWEWKTFTGFPMTYALFAVRSAAAARHPSSTERIHEAFKESRKSNEAEDFQQLTSWAHAAFGGGFDFWRCYFRTLQYRFTAEQRKGLELFYQMLEEEGFLHTAPDLTFWKPEKRDAADKVDIT